MADTADSTRRAYHVTADGQSAEFAFEKCDGVLHVQVGGQWQPVTFHSTGGATLQEVRVGARELRFGQRKTPEGIEIVADGAAFAAQTQDARSVRYAGMVRKAPGAGRVSMKAPMPGLIVTVLVKPGDAVTKDQTIVTLSAMKLENDIRSPAAGVVKSVNVEAGQAVEKGTLLAVIE
jgi:biotin carboxyl carrier protein